MNECLTAPQNEIYITGICVTYMIYIKNVYRALQNKRIPKFSVKIYSKIDILLKLTRVRCNVNDSTTSLSPDV